MAAPVREEVVQRFVALLRDKPESERAQTLALPILSSEEADEVRRRLYERQPEPRMRSPKGLREDRTFQRLVQDVRRGKAFLFLGAGVSQEAGMPGSTALVDALVSLAQSYRVDLPEPTDEGQYTLPAIADRLERAGLRRELIEALKSRIEGAYQQQPPPHSRGIFPILPELTQLNKVILTTNWDELIEQTFREGREPVAVIRRDRELALMAVARRAVVKLHGDFADPELLVVSETDYISARNAILKLGGLAGSLWGYMGTLLAQYSFIFVGYRGADTDTQLLRALVANRQLFPETRRYMVGLFDESERKSLRDWVGMEAIIAHAQDFFVALAQELAEFANREDDLDRIFRCDAAPLMEFYAPFGAGKHALLDEIERRAKAEGYADEQIVRIDLSKVEAPVTLGGLVRGVARVIDRPWISRGEDLRTALESKDRLLMLIENTEHLGADQKALADFVSGLVVPAIDTLNERLAGRGLPSRLIVCGRHRVEAWSSAFRRRAEIFPLSSFTEAGVAEMIRKFVRLRAPTTGAVRPAPELVKQVYQITGGGRPRFVKAILEQLAQEATAGGGAVHLPRELTEREVKRFLKQFMDETRREVWGDAVSQGFITLYERCICVLRRMNSALLARLGDNETCASYFVDFELPDGILVRLRACRLVSYEYPLEVVDPLVRRIHSRALQEDAPEQYVAAHVAAASAWYGLLSTVTDLIQCAYVQEWLYHWASSMQQEDWTQERRWLDLSQKLDHIKFKTQQPYATGIGRLLIERIEEKRERDRDRDGELLEALINCLGEEYYEAFRRALISKTEETA